MPKHVVLFWRSDLLGYDTTLAAKFDMTSDLHVCCMQSGLEWQAEFNLRVLEIRL